MSTGCGDDGGSGPNEPSGGTAGAAAGAKSGGMGGSSPGTGGASGGSSPANGEPAKLGGFVVSLKTDTSVTSFAGSVYDGATPDKVIWKQRALSSGCELVVPEAPFCDPACGQNVCVEGNRCVANPKAIGVGNVRVQGVGAEFSMSPTGDSPYYAPPPGVTLPYPPAADGAAIRLDAEGGAFGPFMLESEGILPFELTSANPAALESGKPLVLAWQKGTSDRARIELELDLSHHGGTKGKIQCDVADTGSIELPASLITELVGLGISGFPILEISRRARGSAKVAAGEVDLSVTSQLRVDVTVPGLVSCQGDEECPTGQTCQADLQCK